MEYTQVPRRLIENASLGSKRVLVYLAIHFAHWDGYDISELVHACGYSATNQHANSVYGQIKEVVDWLLVNGYLDVDHDGAHLANQDDCSGFIYRYEYDLIFLSHNTHTINCRSSIIADTLLVLSNIRCYMTHAQGRPQFYSNMLCRISEHIGISVRRISRCVQVLEELGIIHSEELPRYKDGNGHWHSNVRIFVNRHGRLDAGNTYDWQKETKRGIAMILANIR